MEITLLVSMFGVITLAVVHLFSYRLDHRFDALARIRWLSFAGGVSLSYVFLHLLPSLEEDRVRIAESFKGIFTLHNELVYLVTLCGAMFVLGIHRLTSSEDERQRRAATKVFDLTFWISIGSFALHNALITHSLHNRSKIGVEAVALFVVAMTLHFTVNDYGMRRRFFAAYQQTGRWLLALAILAGWLAGFVIDTGDVPFLLILSFISGGTVMHVLSEEIPEDRGSNYRSFFLGGVVYSGVLLLL